MKREDGLAVGAEEHEIGFPMAGPGAIGGAGRPQGNQDAVFDMFGGASSFVRPRKPRLLLPRGR